MSELPHGGSQRVRVGQKHLMYDFHNLVAIDLNLDKDELEYLDQILLYLAKMSLFSY